MIVCHQYDEYKNYVGSVYIGEYVGGYDGLNESELLYSVNCVQSAFL